MTILSYLRWRRRGYFLEWRRNTADKEAVEEEEAATVVVVEEVAARYQQQSSSSGHRTPPATVNVAGCIVAGRLYSVLLPLTNLSLSLSLYSSINTLICKCKASTKWMWVDVLLCRLLSCIHGPLEHMILLHFNRTTSERERILESRSPRFKQNSFSLRF